MPGAVSIRRCTSVGCGHGLEGGPVGMLEAILMAARTVAGVRPPKFQVDPERDKIFFPDYSEARTILSDQ